MNKNLVQYVGANFNFNYNPATQRAVYSYDLGSGISCSNCYAYIGVYIYAVIEYWWNPEVYYFAFEAKLDGGIGVRNPCSILKIMLLFAILIV